MPRLSTSVRARRLSIFALSATLTAAAGIGISTPAQAASNYKITGVVTGLDATGKSVPITGAWLYASPVSSTDFRNIHGTVDASGRFTIDVGTPGDYTLYADCSAPCSDTYATKYFTAADGVNTTIKVATTTPVTANIAMPRWATVKGKVTNNAGVALAGIEVASAPSVGSNYAQTKTDSAGNYTLTKVMPGRNTISARDTSTARTWQAEYWNGTATSSPTYPTTPPNLAAGPTVTTANFQLDPQLAMIGQVVDNAGAPIAGVGYNFLTYNAATGVWDPPQKGPLVTDARGQFFEPTVLGGKYKVCFSDDYYGEDAPVRPYRYGAKCWDNTTSFDNATIYTQASSPAQRTLRVVLPVAGKSLTASDVWISGTPTVGRPLQAYPGTWGPTGVELSYQWGYYGTTARGRVFTPISGATSATFTPTANLQGVDIDVKVTGTLAGYVTASMMAGGARTVGSSVALSSNLAISGSPVAGQTITAIHGTPTTGEKPTSEIYEWRVEGKSVGWGKSFTVTPDLAGKRIEVRYQVATATRTHTDFVAVATGLYPLTGPTPTISGTVKMDSRLTAVPGTWSAEKVSFSYQWFRAGVPISGATSSTYNVMKDDVGKAITVRITGSKPGYVTVIKTSAPTAAVAPGTLSGPAPTIYGQPSVGLEQTVNVGTWSPASYVVTYQWFRSGTAISGATQYQYVPTLADKGHALTVRVTVTKVGYTPASKMSAPTAVIK